MPLTLVRTSDAETEPATTAEAKSHLRVDTSADDTYIATLVTAARQHVEEVTGRSLITQTWRLSLDDFPLTPILHHPWSVYAGFRERPIYVPRPPLQSITQIQYVDTDGSTQTLASSKYRVDSDSEPGRITEAEGETWPTTDPVTNAVTVTFDAGYGDAASDVPQAIRHAILLLVGHWYENREDVHVGSGTVFRVPKAADALLAPYRVWL